MLRPLIPGTLNTSTMQLTIQEFIGQQISTFRKLKGYTQDDLAIHINSQREQISKLERGLNDIKISTLEKIAEALDIQAVQLLAGYESPAIQLEEIREQLVAAES